MSTEQQVISKEAPTSEKKESKEVKEFKNEKCPEHNWKPLLFYCSCGKFLCVLCLKNHSHDNMNFCDIKTFYNNVLTEMEQILKLIDRYSAELVSIPGNSQNKKLESIIYTRKSLINLFHHREILYSLSLMAPISGCKAKTLSSKSFTNVSFHVSTGWLTASRQLIAG